MNSKSLTMEAMHLFLGSSFPFFIPAHSSTFLEMEKALSIPEIRIHIGQFLSIRDLKNCVTLSKTWAESLTPWLWRSVTIQSKDDPAFLEIVSKHAGHVHTLHLNSISLSKEQFAQFQSLRAIEFGIIQAFNLVKEDIIAMIKCNRPTLRSFRVENCWELPTEALRAILEFPKFKTLSLIYLAPQEKQLVEELLQAFTRVTRLNISMANPSYWSMFCTPTQVFHHLTSLRITALGRPGHLGFLKACPNLRLLRIKLDNNITLNEFTRALLVSCPKLCTLLYFHSNYNIAVKDLNQLAQGLPPMKCLQVRIPYSYVRPAASNMFTHHFNTLQAIILGGPIDSSSPSIQKILTSCPNLQYISGGTLHSHDIDPQAPWVCLGLEHFGVQTQWNKDEQSPIWSQLSRLTRLCSLTIGAIPDLTLIPEPTPFGLDEGLELLAPLKRLAHLEIPECPLEWREEEVEWVIQSWPNLCSIHGKIQQDEEKCNELWKRLNSARIFLGNHDFDVWEYINGL